MLTVLVVAAVLVLLNAVAGALGITAVLAGVPLAFTALAFLLLVVKADVDRRGRAGGLLAVLVLLAPPAGLLVWAVVRRTASG